MRSSCLLAAFILLIGIGSRFGDSSGDLSPSLRQTARSAEVARLRAHFDTMDLKLRETPAERLTFAQRSARERAIAFLREYRNAGVFPRNDRFPDRSMPYFRDGSGALCAMAYLIDRSGRSDLVDRLASTRNHAFIHDLAGDRELLAWLDQTGLSVDEAARIQPAYDEEPNLENTSASTEYLLGTVLSSGASGMTMAINALAPSATSGWMGVAAGVIGIAAGGVRLDGNSGTKKAARVNMIAGGSALAAGIFGLVRSHRESPEETASSSTPDVSIAPAAFLSESAIGMIVTTNF